MTPEEVQDLVHSAIRAHEVRVGIVSGIAGLLIIGGIFHAFWLLR